MADSYLILYDAASFLFSQGRPSIFMTVNLCVFIILYFRTITISLLLLQYNIEGRKKEENRLHARLKTIFPYTSFCHDAIKFIYFFKSNLYVMFIFTVFWTASVISGEFVSFLTVSLKSFFTGKPNI